MNIVNFCQTLSLKMFCVKIRDMKWVCPPPTPRAPRSDVFVRLSISLQICYCLLSKPTTTMFQCNFSVISAAPVFHFYRSSNLRQKYKFIFILMLMLAGTPASPVTSTSAPIVPAKRFVQDFAKII